MQDIDERPWTDSLEQALDKVVQEQIAFCLEQVSAWDKASADRMLDAFLVMTQSARQELKRLQDSQPEILSINNGETP